MAYLQLYRDSLCTNLFMSIPVAEITCEPTTAPSSLTYDGKTYKFFDWNNSAVIQQVPVISQNPPFITSRNRVPSETTMYFKNGVSVRVRESTSTGRLEHFRFGNNDLAQSNNNGATESNPAKLFAISFSHQGVKYIGFTGWFQGTQPNYFRAICCVEASFWSAALRPPYSYGQGEDPDGGQGSGGGTFRRTGVDDTSPPAGLIPTSASGRGLHAYVISATDYGDLQNYLWGDSSTTAKALWQKFQNKIHSPASCIVAVYALPADFMPTGGAAVNIRLAGITLPVSANSVQLDFASYEVTFDPIEKPFRNFADYSHVTCKMYVPYCGEIPIPVEAAYGRAIKCRYWVDQFNGNLVARVSCGDINIGELSSNVAYRIPIIGGDDGSLDRIGAALTGIAQVSAGNYSGALGSAAEMATAPYTAQIINADFSGSISACTFRRPYVEWTANETYYSDEFLRTRGVPARYAAPLSSFSGGYLECITKVSSVNIPSATDAEREEIESILRGGLFA